MSNSFNMLIPQNVRGTYKEAYLATISGTFVDIINVIGHGKLYKIFLWLLDPADTIAVALVIDGKPSQSCAHTGDTNIQIVVPSANVATHTMFLEPLSLSGADANLFSLEFSTSLIVKLMRYEGSANYVCCQVYYSLDTF